MADRCPTVERDIEYYFQRGDSEEEVGQTLANSYYEWAWGEGRNNFPEEFLMKRITTKIFILNTLFPNILNHSLLILWTKYQISINKK